MHTGITSVAKLPDMTAVYPFAGAEWIYALIALAFTVYFVVSQINMEKSDMLEDHGAPSAEAGFVAAE